jgi:hypothetical protein
MFTSAKATKRFFERSYEKLLRKIVSVIAALASFRDIVFFYAVLLVNLHPVILLTRYEEAPKTSMVEEVLASLESKTELTMLKTDCVVTKITPPISCAKLS